jgi:hypothetical protein
MFCKTNIYREEGYSFGDCSDTGNGTTRGNTQHHRK